MFSAQKHVYLIVIPALVLQFIGAAIYFGSFSQFVEILYPLTKGLMILWPLFWLVRGFRPRVVHGEKKHVAWVGIGSGVLLSAVLFMVYFSGLEFFHLRIDALRNIVDDFGIWNYYLLFAIFLSVFHSAFEEFYWRWFVFGSLKKITTNLGAMVIGSVAFASHHILILSQFFPLTVSFLFGGCIAIAGIIWCLIYQKTNSLLSSWLSHMLVDASILWIGYLLLA